MKNGFSNRLILYNFNLFTSRSNFNKHIHRKSRPIFTKLIQALSQMWNNCDRSIVKSGVFSMIIIIIIKHPLIQIFKSNRWKACAAQQHTYGKSPKNRPKIKLHQMEQEKNGFQFACDMIFFLFSFLNFIFGKIHCVNLLQLL